MLSAQFQFPKKGSKNKADNGKTVIFVMDQLAVLILFPLSLTFDRAVFCGNNALSAVVLLIKK